MTCEPAGRSLAPGVPEDYYRRIYEVERIHWWHRGMRAISAALLGARLRRGGAILDAGCGTGGFLRWALDQGSFSRACGVDVAGAALELAAGVVPEADLRKATLSSLPFDANEFGLVVVNDVLQHVAAEEMPATMAELERVLAPDGSLLVRTNGGLRAHEERHDWRVYDRRLLMRTLSAGRLRCDRCTYANTLGSIAAATRGRVPHAPQPQAHGIPAAPSAARNAAGYAVLWAEARYLAAGRWASLPYGHTMLALAHVEKARDGGPGRRARPPA